MDNQKPLLSICIPTYNRSQYLKKSIDSIVIQKEFLNGSVEIVISDNASTDDTEGLLRPYVEKYSNFYYFRNKKNVRDKNFPLVLSKAHGKLRRLCNDTICFREGSLEYMCEIVKKYEKTKPHIFWLASKDNHRDEILTFRQSILSVSYLITWIACFSIWDFECIGIDLDTSGTELHLWQVRKTLQLSSEKDKVLLVYKNLIYTQDVYKKDISYGLYHVFYENYFALLNPYFENGKLTNADKDYLERDLLLNFFPEWCVKWKLQNTSLQYLQTEDLCAKIYQEFHSRSYWQDYKKRFNKLYWKLRIREIFKKILRRN